MIGQAVQLLDVVALIEDVLQSGLRRGQVGTVVEALDQNAYLVEFSDDEGRAYAIVPLTVNQMLVLQYEQAEVV